MFWLENQGPLNVDANTVQAQEQHRAYLKSLPATSYPLEPQGDAAEVNEAQRVTEGGLEQR